MIGMVISVGGHKMRVCHAKQLGLTVHFINKQVVIILLSFVHSAVQLFANLNCQNTGGVIAAAKKRRDSSTLP